MTVVERHAARLRAAFLPRRESYRLRREAGHDVPRAGTLGEIAICRRCGNAFDDVLPCPNTTNER